MDREVFLALLIVLCRFAIETSSGLLRSIPALPVSRDAAKGNFIHIISLFRLELE